MPSYIVVYSDKDWERNEAIWYQTIFQRVSINTTLIVSVVCATRGTAPVIERAGIFTSVHDNYGQHWKLICWVQLDELVLVQRW